MLSMKTSEDPYNNWPIEVAIRATQLSFLSRQLEAHGRR